MFLRQLALRDFRSWRELDIALTPGCTVFVGRNGQGKTNILEAVRYLSILGSHRASTDQALVRQGTNEAHISGIAVNAGRELAIDIGLRPGKTNKAWINRSPARRPSETLGIVHTVMFAPEDLAIVKGDPAERRRYIDELMVAVRPRYSVVRSDYEKVVRQRSALLKSISHTVRARKIDDAAAMTLETWDRHLARAGAEYLQERFRMVKRLDPFFTRAYAGIAPDSRPARMQYRCSLADVPEDASPVSVESLENKFLEQLPAIRDKEIERGVCLVGPHRDDLDLMLGDQPVKGFASHGESWSTALALRLASLALLRDEGWEPILLLDDVFAELDRKRREALVAIALDSEQVLVTAAVREDVPEALSGRLVGVQAILSDLPDSLGQRVSEIIRSPGRAESEGV
ncbi:DNA replication/repair protein RecF [Lolliginicoccus levis]|uniref:DNA replication/repair protein RecF n=1 Tax=Lolliginicoccus levis TaxID=2919542 RepID=UPI00241D8C4A|nr:DNA replication/repair protein RecF [Lolliginicoccus levis]